MTLQNANPVFCNEGEEVSTGRTPFVLNPEATVFEPPASYAPAQLKESPIVNSFMNEDGLQSSCGNMVPTADISPSSFVKESNNEMPSRVDNDLQSNAMTEGQMADTAAPQEITQAEQTPAEDAQDGAKANCNSEEMPVEAVQERQELPKEKITELVLEQLPFFFSRENWSSDPYLLSQMDSDQYVPIHVLASCSQFKQISKNHYSIMDALKQSELVQLDVENHRVRPNYKRCIVILREIPEATPHTEIEELFGHEDCPKAVRCEFINNDSWYVTFDNDDDAQKAYRHLREVVKTFKEKPIAARIKTKPLTRQNCFAVLPPQPKQQPQHQQQTNGNGPPAVPPNSVAQPPVPAPYMGSQRLYYPAAANTPYSYYTGVAPQVQPSAPAFFYPNPMMQWPPTNGNFYDMNSFLHFNGLSPKATFKPSPTGARFPASAGSQNSTGKGGKKWERIEPRSQSVNSNTASSSRVSMGPRTSTASTNSFTAANPPMNLGHARNDGAFPAQNAAYVQNDVAAASNQGLYASFSPPVTTDVDSERTSDVSPIVSGEFGAAFMPTTPYEAPITAGQVIPSMPVGYNAALPGFGPILYRNGYGNDHRQQQRNNGGNRRRPRRDEDQNSNNGQGRGSYQRGYSGDGNSRGLQDRRKPQFNLQATSFPPLPGSDEVAIEAVVAEEPVETAQATAWNVDTQKFSDVMKGTGKSKSEKAETPSAPVTATASKPSQPDPVDNTSQALVKQKQEEAKLEDGDSTEQVQPTKTAMPAPAKEQRIQRPDDKRVGRRDTANVAVQRTAKKDVGKFGAGNKENRPSSAIRPNNRKEDASDEGWNKVKATRPTIPSEKSVPDPDAAQKSNPSLKQARPLTNGDISPPPGLSRLDIEAANKPKVDRTTAVPAPAKNYAEVQKEVDAVITQTNATSRQANSMSWAKMAKSGKDEMEKLSAVIKEKEQEERIKKNRSGGRPQPKPQEKVAQGKDPKSFRRDPKEKVSETKINIDKNPVSAVKVKEFRPKSPKAQ